MDDRGDSCVEQVDVGLEDFSADAGTAGGQSPGAQQHEGAHDFAFDGFADAGGVGADEGLLQLGAQFGGDVALRERAESGRDSVDGLLRLSEGVNGLPVLVHPGQGGFGQGDLRVVAGDVDHLGEGQRIGVEIDECGHEEPFLVFVVDEVQSRDRLSTMSSPPE